MPQKKKKFRFKIPWISGKSRAPPPPTESQSPPTRRAEPQQHPPSHPPQSPTSSVIVDSPVSSPSQSPSSSRPSTPTPVDSPLPSPPPRISQTQDLLLFHDASPSLFPSIRRKEAPPHPAAEETTPPAAPSTSEQEHEKMKSPLKAIPGDLELEKQIRTHHQPDESKEIVVIEHNPVKVGKCNANANHINHAPPVPRPNPEVHTPAHRKQKGAPETLERKTTFAASKVVTNPAESSTSVKGIKDEITNLVQKVATVSPNQHTEDKNVSVVTLAGENRGATMHVGGSNSSKREGSIRIHRGYKTDQDELSTDADENSNEKREDEGELGNAYVNSNIQSVNNSLMLHGSVSERDPGVRVVLPQRQAAAAERPIKGGGGGEVRTNRAEKMSYQQRQPVVRRRCLRGMLMEPSDSEPDKPRRHGCKVRCGDNSKDLF